MSKRMWMGSMLAVALLAPVAQARAPAAVPVRVGGDEVLDACGSLAQVTGLKADGDGFLAVRAGPGAAYAMLDKLGNGREVYLCDSADGDRWLAIVYPTTPGMKCEVGAPIARKQVYRGPCKAGWVRSAWVVVMAG
ncbi:hypothetical protein [Lysobacter capsici]|nr:hypothetical protein [Lysobacter capsici]